MININDFRYKQFVIANVVEGDKIKVSNNQLVILKGDGSTKLTFLLHRLFVLYIIGNFTLTSIMIEKSKRYGFSIIIMSYSFRFISNISNGLEGNTLLHRKQYEVKSNEIGKMIIINKLKSQKHIVMKYESINRKDFVNNVDKYIQILTNLKNPDTTVIMAIEGIVAKQYFKLIFNSDSIPFTKRMPRTKIDPVNTTLDIGYTMLFSFIESLLTIYDFDLYVGVLHKEYYKRKSLVCDMVEPFRYIIDYRTRKNWNTQVFKISDFEYKNHGYHLKKDNNKLYVREFMTAILENKMTIFRFIQSYYRWFMKNEKNDKFVDVNYDVND